MSIVTSYHGVPGNFSGSPYTRAMAVSFNQRVKLSSIGHYGTSSAGGSAQSYVWSVGKVLIASGNLTAGTFNTTTPLWAPLTTPIILEANTTYYIGGYQNAALGYYSQSASHAETTVDGFTMTSKVNTTVYYVANNSTNPFNGSAISSYEFPFALDVVTPDNAPVVAITSPTANQKVDPRKPLVVTWSYSDADNDPQTEAWVSWRKNGSGQAFMDYQVTGAATSYTLPANTLSDGYDIELKVQAYNAKANTVSPSVVFNSDSWNYDAEVVTSTQSGLWTPPVDEPGGTYEIQVATADANGFGPWSSSVQTNVLPFNTAPSAVINSIKAKVFQNQPVDVEWLYSDNENDPQVKYELRLRKKI